MPFGPSPTGSDAVTVAASSASSTALPSWRGLSCTSTALKTTPSAVLSSPAVQSTMTPGTSTTSVMSSNHQRFGRSIHILIEGSPKRLYLDFWSAIALSERASESSILPVFMMLPMVKYERDPDDRDEPRKIDHPSRSISALLAVVPVLREAAITA